MKRPLPPSPVDHPAAYGGLSSVTAASFLVYEANNRLGFDLSLVEASMIVAVTTWAYFFLFGPKKASEGQSDA